MEWSRESDGSKVVLDAVVASAALDPLVRRSICGARAGLTLDHRPLERNAGPAVVPSGRGEEHFIMADIDSNSPAAGAAGRPSSPMALIIAGVGVLVAAVLLVVIVLLRDADDAAPPATSVAPETAVWPWEASSTRFEDPVDAARSFATEFLGFTAPVVGPFAQGDSRSGEVEVRPRDNGPASTVFVRQGSDDSWWVIGAATEHITLDEPEVLDEIRSPVRLRGTALAFEGTVQVHIREDGRREPIGVGLVTGGGQEPSPFEGTIEFSTPKASAGAIVLFTQSAEDGRVWQAGVVRVRFSRTSRKP